MRAVLAYLAAVIVTYLLAATAASQHVLARLSEMGVAVPLADRLQTTVHDWCGMFSSFLPLLSIGLLIALPVARLLARRWPGARSALFALAGAAAVIAVHVALTLAFDIHPVAASRTLPGLLLQGLCGAIGGWLFARIKPAPLA